MAIVLINTPEARVEFRGKGGVPFEWKAILVFNTKMVDLFTFRNVDDLNKIVIAHRKDIVSIRARAWDNIKKKEVSKNITLEEFIEHSKSIK